MDSSRGYNLLAPFYDALTFVVFGKTLFRAQIQFLGAIPNGSKVLVLGGGTGRWLRQSTIHKANPEITYVDLSRAMIEKARVNGAGLNIKFVEGTQKYLRGGEEFDVVVAFCFFDLFDNNALTEVIDRIDKSMKRRGRWMVVDFVNCKWWHARMLSIMYAFFRIVTKLENRKLPEWQDTLKAVGAREEKGQEYYGGFIKSGLWVVP